MNVLTIKSQGLDSLISKLDTLVDPVLSDRRISTAMRASAVEILAAAKLNVPVRYGFLRDSLIITSKIIKRGRDSGMRSVRVGANSRRLFQLLKKPSSKSNSFTFQIGSSGPKDKTISKPHKYLHLIEFGTKTARAFSPLRRAYQSHGGEHQVRRFANGLDKAIARVMRKKGKTNAS
jgi:HK97 gp10 family phage protein